MDKRKGRVVWGPKGTRSRTSDDYWRQPLKWNRDAEMQRQRARVFCASLADVFEDWQGTIKDAKGHDLWYQHEGGSHYFRDIDVIVDRKKHHPTPWGQVGLIRLAAMDDLRRDLFALIDKTPWLDWLLLTKRPENIKRMWPSRRTSLPPATEHDGMFQLRGNVWLLTSVSDQATANVMIPELLKCRDLVTVLGVSAEPLLGSVDLRPWIGYANYPGNVPGKCVNIDGETWHKDGEKCQTCGWGYPNDPDRPGEVRGIDWVIAGAESGHGARSMQEAWARDLKNQCVAAGVSYFLKQYATPKGKKIPLPVLDGQQWTEMPKGLVPA